LSTIQLTVYVVFFSACGGIGPVFTKGGEDLVREDEKEILDRYRKQIGDHIDEDSIGEIAPPKT